MPIKSGYQKCRRCGERKKVSHFPTTGRDCDTCIEEGAAGNIVHPKQTDPFRHGVDVDGFNKFLRMKRIEL